MEEPVQLWKANVVKVKNDRSDQKNRLRSNWEELKKTNKKGMRRAFESIAFLRGIHKLN